MESGFTAYVRYAVIRECLGKWQLQEGVLDSHNIMFVASGECDICIDGEYHRLRAGDVSYCPTGARRSGGGSTEDAVIYAFDFDLYGADRLPLESVTHLGDLGRFSAHFREFFAAWYEKADGYGLFCSGIFLVILSDLLYPRAKKMPNKHVSTIKEYIVDHLGEPITVEALARLVNLSPIYCGALFMKNEGMTIHEFVNIMRINKAKDLLARETLPVSEVALSVGFSDVFYFCKTFKKLTGMTPTSYRRSARK